MTSFRLRVVVLIVFLVATSSAATAWLTLRQASKELTASVTASQRDVEAATRQLAAYGHLHGGWDGVQDLVGTLSAQLGQRIRVATESDAVVADSDLIAGRAARPVVGAPSVVDARPVFDTTLGGRTPSDRLQLMFGAIDAYPRDQAYAACLTRAGVPTKAVQGKGFPFVEATGGTDAAEKAGCPFPRVATRAANPDIGAGAKRCLYVKDDTACFRQMFAEAIRPAAPAQLRLYIGARDEVAHRLPTSTIALAAGLVIMVAALSALLLSRRVLRPIGALTRASRRLGAGGLDERVPVTGRDELAELARAFNRMAESLQSSEERQRRLVGDIAHELRTPLANLRGYLEALTDGVLRPTPELFASLHEEALLQQRIVDDLQELALAEAGALAYHKTTVDLAELAETCRTAFLAGAERAGVDLSVQAEPVTVHGDPDRLRQVISNLLRNALAATASGGTIRVLVRSAGDRAVVEVADTGRGIAEDDLPHVFDRFWRADAARGRSTGGSGLGLAIAKEIVTAHGGGIAIASVVGQGTVVTADLPRL